LGLISHAASKEGKLGDGLKGYHNQNIYDINAKILGLNENVQIALDSLKFQRARLEKNWIKTRILARWLLGILTHKT
jgi:hypothetical protein